jgi:hypothetical protein
MEIHYHPKRSKKKKKQVKEYLLEFAVIFIAIIGSYFAENLREHFVDRRQAKEYMERLLQDLKADTNNISRTIALNIAQSKGLDSMINTMKKPIVGSNLYNFYSLSQKYATSYFGYSPISTTMTQLMSTGSLRLVKKRAVAEGIIKYEKAKSDALKVGEFTGSQISKIIDQQSEIFDFLSINRLSENSNTESSRLKSILLETGKSNMSVYFYKIQIYNSSIYINMLQLEEVKNQSTSLIKLIQKEYDLK